MSEYQVGCWTGSKRNLWIVTFRNGHGEGLEIGCCTGSGGQTRLGQRMWEPKGSLGFGWRAERMVV